MGERQQDIALERLILDRKRRGLVESFVDNVAKLPSVEKIGVVTLGKYKPSQWVFVFTEGREGIPEARDVQGVMGVVEEVCKTEEERRLLGLTPVTTDQEFRTDQVDKLAGIRLPDPVIIWKRHPALAPA